MIINRKIENKIKTNITYTIFDCQWQRVIILTMINITTVLDLTSLPKTEHLYLKLKNKNLADLVEEQLQPQLKEELLGSVYKQKRTFTTGFMSASGISLICCASVEKKVEINQINKLVIWESMLICLVPEKEHLCEFSSSPDNDSFFFVAGFF